MSHVKGLTKDITKRDTFDAVWYYEIIGGGSKFIEQNKELSKGVLESTKSYFIIFRKQTHVAIFLWRGRD